MAYGDFDSALRKLMNEALEPMKRKLDQVLEQQAKGRPSDDTYLTVAKAAEKADVSPGTIRRWIREGKLVRYKAGRAVRVSRVDLEAFMRSPSTEDDDVIDFASRANEMLRDD